VQKEYESKKESRFRRRVVISWKKEKSVGQRVQEFRDY